MSSSKNLKIFAVALLICQLANLAFWHPAHIDFPFASGQSQTRVTDHSDADHCKHLPLGEHSQCAICLASQSRISIEPSAEINLGVLELVGRCVAEHTLTSQQNPLSDSFYRRGPPTFLG